MSLRSAALLHSQLGLGLCSPNAMDESNYEKPEYASYNGLGRTPVLWGVPYMAGLFTMVFALMGALLLSTLFGGIGWLFALIAIPVFLFFKMICADDDGAIEVLKIEAIWFLRKMVRANAKHHGNTLTIVPAGYGRKLNDIKRYFKKSIVG